MVKGVLYTLGWRGNGDTLHALNAVTGEVMWNQFYPNPNYGRHATGDQGFFQGTTPAPEFDDETGLLYSLSCDGALNCWDTNRRGATIWSLNLFDAYKDLSEWPRRSTDTVGTVRQDQTGAPDGWFLVLSAEPVTLRLPPSAFSLRIRISHFCAVRVVEQVALAGCAHSLEFGQGCKSLSCLNQSVLKQNWVIVGQEGFAQVQFVRVVENTLIALLT
jgi:outer membrane protein assembly factor BamB